MIQLNLMKRKLPYNEQKKAFYFQDLVFGNKDKNGKRIKLQTTRSYWIGFYFFEVNVKLTKHAN